jgi:hypothetical protein
MNKSMQRKRASGEEQEENIVDQKQGKKKKNLHEDWKTNDKALCEVTK